MTSIEDAPDRIRLGTWSVRLKLICVLLQWLFHYGSQLELQAISACGWLLTKAAEPATSRPKTTVNARNFVIDQTESRLLNLNFQMVGGGNENGHGQQYGFPVAVLGRDVQHSACLHTLHSYGDIAGGAGEALRHDPENCEAVFREDHAHTTS